MPPKPSAEVRGDGIARALLEELQSGEDALFRKITEYAQDPAFLHRRWPFHLDPSVDGHVRHVWCPQPKATLSGTVLAFATLIGATKVVRKLVEWGADTEEPFVISVPWSPATWVGAPAFGAISQGNLQMLQTLIEVKAQVSSRCIVDGAACGATLLWEAAYYGHLGIVRYLLSLKAVREQLNQSARSQDDPLIMQSPLHVAASRGHADVVQELVGAGASLARRSIDGPNSAADRMTPLVEAIRCGHAEVVRVLVANGASVCSAETVFALGSCTNSAIKAAFADGLRTAWPNSAKTLLAEDAWPVVCPLLHAPGAAPRDALNAMFVSRKIEFWDNNLRQLDSGAHAWRKCVRHTAHLAHGSDGMDDINVACGPDHEAFSRCFRNCVGLTTRLHGFLNELMPRAVGLPDEPVSVRQCIVEDVQHHPRILAAIAAIKDDAVFDEPSCKAILTAAWRKVLPLHVIDVVCHALLLVLLFGMILSFGEVDWLSRGELRLVIAIFLLIFSGRAIVFDSWQAFGLWQVGASFDTQSALFSCFNISRIVLTLLSAGILLSVYIQGEVSSDFSLQTWQRLVVGAAVLLRWFILLWSLQVFGIVGPWLLPMCRALLDVFPFGAFIVFPLFGFSQAYHALGIRWLPDAIFDVMRLGVLGDVDLDELEDTRHGYSISGGEMTYVAAVRTEMYYPVRLLMLMVGILFTAATMNVFIGMVGQSYRCAHDHRLALFWRERSRVVRNQAVVRHARRQAKRGCGRRRDSVHPISDVQVAVPAQHGLQPPRHSNDAETRFVWYCCRTKPGETLESAPVSSTSPRSARQTALPTDPSQNELDDAVLAGPSHLGHAKACEQAAGFASVANGMPLDLEPMKGEEVLFAEALASFNCARYALLQLESKDGAEGRPVSDEQLRLELQSLFGSAGWQAGGGKVVTKLLDQLLERQPSGSGAPSPPDMYAKSIVGAARAADPSGAGHVNAHEFVERLCAAGRAGWVAAVCDGVPDAADDEIGCAELLE